MEVFNMKKIFVLILFMLLIAMPALAREKVELSLDEATRMAISQSFDIQMAKLDAQIAGTDELSAKSLYDLILSVEATYQKDKSKKTTTILGTQSQDNIYNIGLSQTLPTGTTVEIGWNNARSATNSSFATSSVTHESVYEAVLTQDLGRNLFGIQDRGDIKVRLIDIENAEYNSLDRIEALMVSVQKAYVDVVLHQEFVRIEEEMLQTAKTLYDIQKDKIENGLIEKAELIASESNYLKREGEVKLARSRLEEKKNVLKLLLALGKDDELMITDHFSSLNGEENYSTSIKKAFEHRVDYKRKRNELEAEDIKVKMTRQNLWPEINLMATYERNGLGDGFTDARDDITENDNPNYIVGISLAFPLQNRDARAKHRAQKFQKAKLIESAKKLEREIVLSVTDKVRNANVLAEIVSSRSKVADLESQKLEEEDKRFSRGRSDTDMLIRFQEDAIEAKRLDVNAKYDYSAALIDLRRAEGSLLKHFWEEEF